MKNYKSYVTAHIGPSLLPWSGDDWQAADTRHTHICKELHYNFIDGKVPKYCSLKGTIFANTKIHYHRWSKCLTSSQVLCISFFKKFFEKPEYEKILLMLLRKCGLEISVDVEIQNAILEYEPDPDEGTNFDFYLILSNGQHISFEIKYTETEFGSISPSAEDPDKYNRKWENIYYSLVQQCPYLKTAYKAQERFYQHYQISRNIAWASTSQDIVVFLTPRSNESLTEGREYIDSFRNPNIMNLYWEEVMDELLELIQNQPELKQYYDKLHLKYFQFI